MDKQKLIINRIIINRTNDYDLKQQRNEARRWSKTWKAAARKMKAERDHWDECHRVLCRVEIDLRKCITELQSENQRLEKELSLALDEVHRLVGWISEKDTENARLREELEQMTAERDSESRWAKEYLDSARAWHEQFLGEQERRAWIGKRLNVALERITHLEELIKQVEWGCDPHDVCPYYTASQYEVCANLDETPGMHDPTCHAWGDDGVMNK